MGEFEVTESPIHPLTNSPIHQLVNQAIVDPMVRRCFPLLLALAVAGAPTALAMCQADCAATTHSSHTHPRASGHTCHDDGSGSGARMQSGQQPCSHAGELAATSGARVQASAASAFVAVPTSSPLVVSRLAPFANWRFAEPNPHESVRFRSIVSLRI